MSQYSQNTWAVKNHWLPTQLANALHLLLFIYLFGLASQMQVLAAGNF